MIHFSHFIRAALVALVVALLASSVSAIPQSANRDAATTDLSATVAQTLERSQKLYGVQLATDAQTAIQNGFFEEDSFLKATFARMELSPEERTWLLRTLVEEYVCDLRDQERQRMQPSPIAERKSSPRLVQVALPNQLSSVSTIPLIYLIFEVLGITLL